MVENSKKSKDMDGDKDKDRDSDVEEVPIPDDSIDVSDDNNDDVSIRLNGLCNM